MDIKTVVTHTIAEKMQKSNSFHDFVFSSIARHLSGDWGDISENDKAVNDIDPVNALSAYTVPNGTKIWIKRDVDILTVLFPSEY